MFDIDITRVIHNSRAERIRLWGIDCPEKNQPFGTRARQFTGDLAFGQTVTVKAHDTDRYGRTVAEIILPDGRNLNHEIVRAGLGWWYERYARHENALAALEQQAQAARRGLGRSACGCAVGVAKDIENAGCSSQPAMDFVAGQSLTLKHSIGVARNGRHTRVRNLRHSQLTRQEASLIRTRHRKWVTAPCAVE